MSIFSSLFGGNAASAPEGGESGAGEGGTGAAPAPTGESATPQNPQQQGTGQGEGEVSPLDAFKELWNNEPTEGNDGKSPDTLADPSQLFNIDPESIQKAVAQMDFSQSVNPEHLQAITEGGEGAQKAFAESMNAVARQVFSQSMVGSAKLVEQALGRASQSLDSRIDNRFRSSQTQEAVTESNPVFKHPAAQPMVQALQQQLATKHPTASSKEIADMANQYFKEFANSITEPERRQQESQRRSDEPDWETFFNS